MKRRSRRSSTPSKRKCSRRPAALPQDVDGIGERKDAVLRTAMPGQDATTDGSHSAGGHYFIVMAITGRLADASTPNLAPRRSSTTPLSLRSLTAETPAATAAPPPTPV